MLERRGFETLCVQEVENALANEDLFAKREKHLEKAVAENELALKKVSFRPNDHGSGHEASWVGTERGALIDSELRAINFDSAPSLLRLGAGGGGEATG